MKKQFLLLPLMFSTALSMENPDLMDQTSTTQTAITQEEDTNTETPPLPTSQKTYTSKDLFNAGMYGGPVGNAIYDMSFKRISYYLATKIKYATDASSIFNDAAGLRHDLAVRSNTPKAEDFKLPRNLKSVPWSSGAATGVMKYEIMRRNLVENLATLPEAPEFKDLDDTLEYRYLTLSVPEWLTFVKSNPENTYLATFLQRILTGKKENGEDDSLMWYYEANEVTVESGINHPDKHKYNNILSEEYAKSIHLLAFHDKVAKSIKDENKLKILSDIKHTTLKEFFNYQLSLVEIRFKDSDIISRSFMFPTDPLEPTNHRDKPFALIHPPTRSADFLLAQTQALFEKARHFKTKNENRTDAILNKILDFSYHWSITMPYARGSASMNEYLTTALLIYHDLGIPDYELLKTMDEWIQSSFTLDSFKQKFIPLLQTSLQPLEQSIDDFAQEMLKSSQKQENQAANIEPEQNVSSIIPDITYVDGIFKPSTAASMNHLDLTVNYLNAVTDYQKVLALVVNGVFEIVSKLNPQQAILYKGLKEDGFQKLEKCKEAFDKAMVYEQDDATTFSKIQDYKNLYNTLQPFHAGHEVINDLLLFNALCNYHNIIPRLIDGSTLQRPLFKSRHVVASSEARMHELEAFISHMNPSGHASELCEIMHRHNSDKSTVHSYTQLYDFLFNNIRATAENVLEMGIGSVDPSFAYTMGANGTVGASLRGWRDYFSKAQIFGADIAEKELFEEDRIKTFFADQLNIPTIQSMFDKTGVEKFDVIIDDGLHCFQANHTFLRVAIDHLKEGGIYVIEDIAPRGINAFVELLEKMTLDAAFVQLPKQPGRFDNNVFIIFK